MSVIPNNVNGETHPDAFVDDEDDKVDPKIKLTEQTAATAADEEKATSSSSSSSSSSAKPANSDSKKSKEPKPKSKVQLANAAKKAADKAAKADQKAKEEKQKQEKAKKDEEDEIKARAKPYEKVEAAKKSGALDASLQMALRRPVAVVTPSALIPTLYGAPCYQTATGQICIKLEDAIKPAVSVKVPILETKGNYTKITDQLCDPMKAGVRPYGMSLSIFNGKIEEKGNDGKQEEAVMLDIAALNACYKACLHLPNIDKLTDESIKDLDKHEDAKVVFLINLALLTSDGKDNQAYITEQLNRLTFARELVKKKRAEREAKEKAEQEEKKAADAKKKAAAEKDEKTKKSTEKRKSTDEETEVKPSPLKRTRVDKLLKIKLCPVCAEEIKAHPDEKPCPYTVMDDDNKPSSSSSSSSSSSPSAATAAAASDSPKENGTDA